MSVWNRSLRGVLCLLIVPALAVCLSGGCPQTTDTTGDPNATGGPTGSLPTDTMSPTGGASGPPAGFGALLVETVAGAINTEFDIYELPGSSALRSYQSANVPVNLAPGLYRLTQWFNADFWYANDVTITAGATTTVTLGAINVVTVADAADGEYDIYDSTGATEYSSYNAPDVLISAPAGTFVLKEYFNGSFDYATGVTVVAGETTTVEMGAVELVTVAGAVEGEYAIYDSTGTTVYATYNEPDVIITAPPGTFVLKEYFNDRFTYASNVLVQAGEVTTVTMGAIRYNGTQAYDIYIGGTLVSSYNEPGDIVTAPPGTYTLMKYFDDTTVLALNVVVTAGAITDAP